MGKILHIREKSQSTPSLWLAADLFTEKTKCELDWFQCQLAEGICVGFINAKNDVSLK